MQEQALERGRNMAAIAIMGVVRPDPTEAGRTMAERKESAVNDPRFWLQVTAALLALILPVLGVIVSQNSSIRDALQSFIVEATRLSTKQGAEIATLQKQSEEQKSEIKALEVLVNKNEGTSRDYHFALSKELARLQAEVDRRR